MSAATDVRDAAGAWSGVSVHPHRFGGLEYQLAGIELGHLHGSRLLDVPFTKKVRDLLIAEGLAAEHHILKDSGWISFRLKRSEDTAHALWLLKMSYLYRAVTLIGKKNKAAPLSLEEVEREVKELDLTSDLADLFTDLLERRRANASGHAGKSVERGAM